MLTIRKYPIKGIGSLKLLIKGYNGLLSVIEQDNQLIVYSYVNTDNKDVIAVQVAVIGTDQPINGEIMFNWNFLGTVQTQNSLVWHVYYTNHEG
jgi:hypothetical protein